VDKYRAGIIKNGVNNLKEFGYPDADEKNILTDMVYSAFFASMLRDNLGHNDILDASINSLLDEIAKSGEEL
jgi:hypothetical protein